MNPTILSKKLKLNLGKNIVVAEKSYTLTVSNIAYSAIKSNAFDYLLKPVELPDLEKPIEKARRAIENKKYRSTEVINLLHNLDNEADDNRITVSKGENMRLIKTAKLLYIMSNVRYSDLLTSNGLKNTIAKSLKEFEDYFGKEATSQEFTKSVF